MVGTVNHGIVVRRRRSRRSRRSRRLRAQGNNPLWGRANVITTQRTSAALNALAAGNREPNSLLVTVRYSHRHYFFTLASSEDPQNENYSVQNPNLNGQNQEVQDGNGQHLRPAAQDADENNNMLNQNPEVPDANDLDDEMQEDHEDHAQDQN
ncbi:uncharacterized protein LOC122626463 [Drosophila teissieri]|uniref:uncharacterized protein LOC122626463 n=1 Tax=Drosophila teissieri TaxID=7243 RepID=UPI001CBA1B11|nr:uncharacterized protein LOC122626463 [Drosophila teissieri]